MWIEKEIVIYFQCTHNYLVVRVCLSRTETSDQEMKLDITTLAHRSKMTFLGNLLFKKATLHSLALRNTMWSKYNTASHTETLNYFNLMFPKVPRCMHKILEHPPTALWIHGDGAGHLRTPCEHAVLEPCSSLCLFWDVIFSDTESWKDQENKILLKVTSLFTFSALDYPATLDLVTRSCVRRDAQSDTLSLANWK